MGKPRALPVALYLMYGGNGILAHNNNSNVLGFCVLSDLASLVSSTVGEIPESIANELK